MNTYIIEETVSVTYFHKVVANSEEEAREKFDNDEDVEYDVSEPSYGDDAYREFYDEKEYPYYI